jgi:site-specific recombinase XerD
LRASFEYATDEDLIPKNPARKLAMPNIKKKPCERFLNVEEVQALLSEASQQEHLRAGCRPAGRESGRQVATSTGTPGPPDP